MLIIFEIELLNKCSIYWNLNLEYIQQMYSSKYILNFILIYSQDRP